VFEFCADEVAAGGSFAVDGVGGRGEVRGFVRIRDQGLLDKKNFFILRTSDATNCRM